MEFCPVCMHEQHRQLCQKLQGHYAYYGIIGNSRSIASVRHKVLLTWHKWLSRRSRGKAQMTWARYISMLNGNFNLSPARINLERAGLGCQAKNQPCAKSSGKFHEFHVIFGLAG